MGNGIGSPVVAIVTLTLGFAFIYAGIKNVSIIDVLTGKNSSTSSSTAPSAPLSPLQKTEKQQGSINPLNPNSPGNMVLQGLLSE